MATKRNFEILQGKTFQATVRWASNAVVYKPITGITQSAPAVVTAVGHDVPDGWDVAIVSVKGMTQINAVSTPPKEREYHKASVTSLDEIVLSDVNSSEFRPYVSGGYVMYNAPKDLNGFTARLAIKDRIGGTELLRLTDTDGILIDNAAKTIDLTISATVTAAFTWKKAVYELELESADGVVYSVLFGNINVVQEITT